MDAATLAAQAAKEERRQKWEAETPHEEKAAQRAARLAVLRLKFRLRGHVEVAERTRCAIQVRGVSIRNARTKGKAAQVHVVQQGALQRERDRNRRASRIVHLAHCFMRGTTYARIERIC